MSLDRQLNHWVQAGLLDPDQAQRIRAFERQQNRPVFLIAIAGLAAVAVSIGLVAIVAANWERIPGRIKIAVDLAMLVGLGLAVLRLSDRSSDRLWIRETVIVVFYGAVLASIALIGQVYQLGGKSHQALGLWTGLTALLMLQTRSAFAAWCWVIGLQVTYGAWLAWAADSWDFEALALAAIYWAPLLCLSIGSLPVVQKRRPALAQALATIGWSELILCASLGTFAFYSDTRQEDWTGLWPGLAGSSLVTAWLWSRFGSTGPARGARWLLLACLVLAHGPLLISPGDLEVLAALTFIGLWVLLAWVAHDVGLSRLLGMATAVVAIRLVTIYFEVFGDLLGTGAGLVTGGLLTLALVAWWVRRNRRWAADSASSKGDAP